MEREQQPALAAVAVIHKFPSPAIVLQLFLRKASQNLTLPSTIHKTVFRSAVFVVVYVARDNSATGRLGEGVQIKWMDEYHIG